MPRTDIMQLDIRPVRAAGVLLAASGIGGALAEALRPHAGALSSFHQHMVAALTSSRWPAAEWTALIYFVVAAWALWQLLDSHVIVDSPLARAGARLGIIVAAAVIGGLAMAVAAVAVDGFHDTGAHQLLKVGGLANLWLIWAGVGLCFRSGKTATSPSSGREPPRVVATTAGALR